MTKKVKKEKFHFTIIELICLVVIVGLLLFMAFNLMGQERIKLRS